MIEVLRGASLIAATLATGLLAGLFYAFSVSVMPGLRRSGDRTFVETMQQINIAIVNPVFMISFLGAPVLTLAAGLLQLHPDGLTLLPWIAVALVLCLATLGITVGVNIPLNNALDAAGPPAAGDDPAGTRAAFEARWVRFNVVRTWTSIAAFGCLTWALVLYGQTSAT
jgi:uncharacterized membrane protein